MNREVFAQHMAGITAHPDDADAFQAAVGWSRTWPTSSVRRRVMVVTGRLRLAA
jgi:hypothetical protein